MIAPGTRLRGRMLSAPSAFRRDNKDDALLNRDLRYNVPRRCRYKVFEPPCRIENDSRRRSARKDVSFDRPSELKEFFAAKFVAQNTSASAKDVCKGSNSLQSARELLARAEFRGFRVPNRKTGGPGRLAATCCGPSASILTPCVQQEAERYAPRAEVPSTLQAIK